MVIVTSKWRKINNAIVLLLLICALFIPEVKAADEEGPPKIGNFALPASQQPAPLISFGQTLIGKKQAQLILLADKISGAGKHMIDVIPAIVYGITDDFSVLFNVPIAADFKEDDVHSKGLEDTSFQVEYGFYSKSFLLGNLCCF